MKKIVSLLLCFVMVFSLCMINTQSVFAEDQHIKVKLKNYMANDGQTWTKEKYIDFADVQPTLINDRVMVPIRAVAEELGYKVSWHDEKQQVELSKIIVRGDDNGTDINQYARFITMMYNLEAGKAVTNFKRGSFLAIGNDEYADKDISLGMILKSLDKDSAVSACVFLSIDNPNGASYIENFEVGVASAVYVMDTPPIICNGRTLIPLRAAAEMLGLDVSWDDATMTVTISA